MLHISVIGTTTAVVCLWSVSRFLRWCLYKLGAAKVFVVTGRQATHRLVEAFARNGRCQNAATAAAAGVDDERRVLLDRAAAAATTFPTRIEFDDDSINI